MLVFSEGRKVGSHRGYATCGAGYGEHHGTEILASALLHRSVLNVGTANQLGNRNRPAGWFAAETEISCARNHAVFVADIVVQRESFNYYGEETGMHT